MGNLEYSFDNILKSYIDTGKQLTDHQLNLISTNKKMLRTYIRKRVIAVNETKGILSDKEMELVKKYDKKSYDDYITYLTNLKMLSLSNNKLTTLPEWTLNLTNLVRLYLGNNELTNLEGISNLTNLEYLDLGKNNLTSLPEAISNLTNLGVLNLANNELTSIPEGISNLTNLTWLYLSSNNLTTLPEGISNLTNLKELNLFNNKLISNSEKARIRKLLPNTDITY